MTIEIRENETIIRSRNLIHYKNVTVKSLDSSKKTKQRLIFIEPTCSQSQTSECKPGISPINYLTNHIPRESTTAEPGRNTLNLLHFNLSGCVWSQFSIHRSQPFGLYMLFE